jgi:signal transduction histidine kinase
LSDEPESLVLIMLRDLRSDIQGLRAEVADLRGSTVTKGELRSELNSLRADVASDLARLDAKIDRNRKDLTDQIVGLRRAVVEYHTTVVGHGVLISEMEGRLRRVEQTLGLSSEAG